MGIKAMFDAQKNAKFPGDYNLVATVEGEDLTDAFELTNTIENNWWKNTGVVAHFDGSGCRSTSVGDVVVMSTGDVMLCEPVGWKKLE
jgi:hypothetical protein